MDFITRGGQALGAYPEYNKVVERDGLYVIRDRMAAMRHRMSIGTIVSEAAMKVSFVRGKTIGTVEENFIARLRPGDVFTFAGRTLKFVRVRDMTAWVTEGHRAHLGGPPLDRGPAGPLTRARRRGARQARSRPGEVCSRAPEMEAVRPILELQAKWSRLPAPDELLIERVRTREGHHLFFYPVEGRLVHEGMAALFAYRLAQIGPITFTLAANDYGFELLSPDPAPLEEALEAGLVSPDNLLHDIPASLNAAELARRQFREIARVAGLIFQGYPGSNKSVKQVQASSGLLYDVFARYDPENLLLFQAHREVLERQLERSRLGRTLERIAAGTVTISEVERPTPARVRVAGGSGAGAGELGEVSRSGAAAGGTAGAGGGRRHWSHHDSAADVAEDFDDRCMSDVGGRAGLPPERARAVLARHQHAGRGRPALGQGVHLPRGGDPDPDRYHER